MSWRGQRYIIFLWRPRRIAGGYIPALQTVLERQLPLLRRSMGPRLGGDVALCLALDAVVAHGRGGVHSLGDILIRHLRQVTGLGGVEGPDAGQAVRLEFRLNRRALWPGSVCSVLQCTHPVLHIMAVLIRMHICLGERTALGAKACL